jgi:hypothetical protein
MGITPAIQSSPSALVYKEPDSDHHSHTIMQRAAAEVTAVVNEEHDTARQMRFTIRDRRALTIEAHDLSMRMAIPEGGLSAMDTIDISFALGGVERVRGPWLAAQLNRPEFEGAAGPYVAELATLYGADTNRIADLIIIRAQQHQPVTRTIQPLQLHPVEDPLPDDYCVVCLNSSEEETGDWVTIGRCSRHRFHRSCVEGDRLVCRDTCMLCGMQLQ